VKHTGSGLAKNCAFALHPRMNRSQKQQPLDPGTEVGRLRKHDDREADGEHGGNRRHDDTFYATAG
jgi:hypothetical protein